jgi:hypothetical protein
VTHIRQAHKSWAGQPQPLVSVEDTSPISPLTTGAAFETAPLGRKASWCDCPLASGRASVGAAPWCIPSVACSAIATYCRALPHGGHLEVLNAAPEIAKIRDKLEEMKRILFGVLR